MRISFCCADTSATEWLDGLRAALPQAEVSLWHSGAPLADYAVVWAPPQTFFDEQTQLQAVFNTGAGVDALLRLRLPQDLRIVRLDDAGMAQQMAEYVCHALLRYTRGFARYAQQAAHAQWKQHDALTAAHCPVGILGLGVLGEQVARAVAALGFPVNGWSRSPKHLPGVQRFCGAQELPAFLAASRVLVCLLPLTPDTRDLLNGARLALLQPGGYLINVARGAHVVDEDLLALLESGHLAGATLDVFRTEPLPSTHPFWTHPHITVTPHISARTLVAESIAQIAGKIIAVEQGQPVRGEVDLRRGY
jgi:glyoxylate/hydroxypyruvate reductase A